MFASCARDQTRGFTSGHRETPSEEPFVDRGAGWRVMKRWRRDAYGMRARVALFPLGGERAEGGANVTDE